jgi:hypothetical protein
VRVPKSIAPLTDSSPFRFKAEARAWCGPRPVQPKNRTLTVQAPLGMAGSGNSRPFISLRRDPSVPCIRMRAAPWAGANAGTVRDQMGDTMPAFICSTCGPSEAPPALCPVCEDERQFIPPEGQSWTALERLRISHHDGFGQYEPGLIGIARSQSSPSGNAHCFCGRLKETSFGIASR